MTDLQSGRRRNAQQELGLTSEKEKMDIQHSLKVEEARRNYKEMRRIAIQNSSSYIMIDNIARYIDKYCLDPILGLFVPGLGDIMTSVLTIPFIYISLFKIRSIPLTLAVIFNMLKDMLLGMIPFFIGDVIDVFNRSYLKNLEIITGFVEDDKYVIEEVNRKAVWMGILIAIFGYLIYLLYSLLNNIITWIIGLF